MTQILKSNFFLAIFSIAILSSCASKKKVWYFQDISDITLKEKEAKLESVIQPNDLLTITVNAPNPKVVAPFNAPLVSITSADGGNQNRIQLQQYLVDQEGFIDFPVLGKVKVGGLRKSEVIANIENQLAQLVKEPKVTIRIINYSVTVLGEVARPGVITIDDERVTLLEALGLAGDMTIFGDRNNIIVIREENGVKTHQSLDITTAEIINSDYYYLKQNDVVYVAPNNAQVQGSTFNRNASVFVSVAGIIISVLTIFVRR